MLQTKESEKIQGLTKSSFRNQGFMFLNWELLILEFAVLNTSTFHRRLYKKGCPIACSKQQSDKTKPQGMPLGMPTPKEAETSFDLFLNPGFVYLYVRSHAYTCWHRDYPEYGCVCVCYYDPPEHRGRAC